MAKRGRPPLGVGITYRASVRFARTDAEAVLRAAERAGIPLSEWIRRACMAAL